MTWQDVLKFSNSVQFHVLQLRAESYNNEFCGICTKYPRLSRKLSIAWTFPSKLSVGTLRILLWHLVTLELAGPRPSACPEICTPSLQGHRSAFRLSVELFWAILSSPNVLFWGVPCYNYCIMGPKTLSQAHPRGSALPRHPASAPAAVYPAAGPGVQAVTSL